MKLFISLTACVLGIVVGLTGCKEKKPEQPREIILPPTSPIQKKQKNPYVNLDSSPLDVSYLPSNYPMLRMKQQDTFSLIARVLYSRPHKNNRKIFGDDPESVCKYGIPWRLGANEATEIEFFRNVKFGDTKVAKGRYVMYCIPYADKWIIKLNSRLYSWGLHIDPSDNLYTIEVPTQEQSPAIEDFTIVFEESLTPLSLLMTWDSVKVTIPIHY